ncbi:MAG: 2-isopropylmalate synthase [bacterium]|nr:2-isopropylmalate synthase [bacterium]
MSEPPSRQTDNRHADRRRVEVMDTTLRDGEQTPEVAYTPEEKLQLARALLADVGVDRIEIAGTRVSEGEREAARKICRWAKRAGMLRRIEMLGYCDGNKSVDWLHETGGRVLNLLVKGSEHHCATQLRMAPEQHRKKVAETLVYARKRRVRTNVYLEDWSSGVVDSPDYVFAMLRALGEHRVDRVFLADTLGTQAPRDVRRGIDLMVASFPDVHFEYHCHNDYGFSTANVLAAVETGARGVHTSVNGLGERAGNARLSESVAALHDHGPFITGVNESRLVGVSRLVEIFSGKEVATNTPIVGQDVFTQTAGIHADGDAKGDLYESRLVPARFGRKRRYALGKLSGKASLDQNLAQLGIELEEKERDLVLARIVSLGDKKHTVVPEDLRFIIADVLKTPREHLLRIEHYDVSVGSDRSPEASVELAFRGDTVSAKASGDGGYDAFMNALKKAARKFGLVVPKLQDFRVRIPPGGRTSALVETLITWQGRPGEESFSTLAVDSDQLAAAVIATEKMLNVVAARSQET